ncbi:thiamine-phosphate kinase, partial [Candidatus Microgenomates bacterium]|nr:thiamine-phosphate kinase [Candidatus Microgenomates bacterium]
SGAKPGDLVLVTGKLGRKAVVPAARLKEGQILAQSGVVTSMIDISDGLSTDLLHICDESAVGVRIFANKLPVASFSSLDMALNGGEDYELCFTTLPASAEKLIAEVQKKTGTKITIIGEILRKNEGRWLINSDGEEKILKAKGWDHLRNF